MRDATVITFDANGTLFKSRGANMAAFLNALYEKAGVDSFDSGIFYSQSTTSDYASLFDGFLREYGKKYSRLLEVCPQDFSETAWRMQADMPTPGIYDDVIETLESVGHNKLFLVSRTPQDILDKRVDANGIREYFMGVRSVYRRGGKQKEIQNIIGAPYSKKIFVGDEYDDMKIVKDYNSSVKSVKMVGVAVMREDEWNNRDPNDMRAAGADHIIGDLRELAKIADTK